MLTSEKLISLRTSQNLTQDELAAKIGVSRQTISNWERGHVSPYSSNFAKLLQFYQIPIEVLVNDSLPLPKLSAPPVEPDFSAALDSPAEPDFSAELDSPAEPVLSAEPVLQKPFFYEIDFLKHTPRRYISSKMLLAGGLAISILFVGIFIYHITTKPKAEGTPIDELAVHESGDFSKITFSLEGFEKGGENP